MSAASEIVYDGPDGLKLIIDDTDSDTPAIVDGGKGGTATYDCAVATGELHEGGVLTKAQLAWLAPFENEVAEAYCTARAGMPEYD